MNRLPAERTAAADIRRAVMLLDRAADRLTGVATNPHGSATFVEGESIGQRVRRARVRAALTLKELADLCGTSKPYLSLIETGGVERPASDAVLRGIERALGLKGGELVARAAIERTPAPVRELVRRLWLQCHRSEPTDAELIDAVADASRTNLTNNPERTAHAS